MQIQMQMQLPGAIYLHSMAFMYYLVSHDFV